MREEYGDIWNLEGDAVCITTNGFVKNDGSLVMGRGIAKQAANKWPSLPEALGQLVKEHGNHVHHVEYSDANLFSFPVKHVWFEMADTELIRRSADELMNWIEFFGYDDVLLPRPGCGNGRLSWDDVEPEIEPILDDRVVVVSFWS